MKFNLKRDASYKEKLGDSIEQNYGFLVKNIEEANRGVDGETWIITTKEEKKLFAKISYYEVHQPRFKSSLNSLSFLMNNGVTKINQLIRSLSNENYIEFNGGILALFEFIDGEIDYNYPYDKIINLLIDVYKINPADSGIVEEDFNIDHIIDKTNDLLNKAKKVPNLVKVLNSNDKKLKDYIDKLKYFQKVCPKDGLKVITHGDACVNVMVGTEVKLIDWDDAMVSPIERDCWFFMDFDYKLLDIDKALSDNDIQYQLNNELLAFYAYKSALIYLNEDISKYIETPEDDIIQDIDEIFNGWVNKKIEAIK